MRFSSSNDKIQISTNKMYRIFVLLLLILNCCIASILLVNGQKVQDILHRASILHVEKNFEDAINLCLDVLQVEPTNTEAMHILGLSRYAEGDDIGAIKFLSRSIDECERQEITEDLKPGSICVEIYYSNLGEIYRVNGNLENAQTLLEDAIVNRFPTSVSILQNYIIVRQDLKAEYEEIDYLKSNLIEFDPNRGSLYEDAGLFRFNNGDYIKALEIFVAWIDKIPASAEPHFFAGLCFEKLKMNREAINKMDEALAINPNYDIAILCKAALLQHFGLAPQAIEIYENFLKFRKNLSDTQKYMIYNNLGAAYNSGVGSPLAEKYLKLAIEVSPNNTDSLINLGQYYAECGETDQAHELYHKALALNGTRAIHIRSALTFSPIVESIDDIKEIRQEMMKRLDNALQTIPAGSFDLVFDSIIDRIHFYLVYHGMDNDRQIQEKVAELYMHSIRNLFFKSQYLEEQISYRNQQQLQLPVTVLDTSNDANDINNYNINNNEILRIGFISKFFGNQEPHGLLLEGIMKGLPRNRFYVIGLYPPAEGKADVLVQEAVDELHRINTDFGEIRQHLSSLKLDILVFADMNSDVTNHFLGYARISPIQILFWGNPITSGNPSIDYFVSADRMENPNRTKFASEEDPYSEQVVLLDGQGIWYSKPTVPETWTTLEDYGFDNQTSKDWNVYLCAQSTFKLHPDYDEVILKILEQDPNAHILFLQARREKWTTKFQTRLLNSISETLFSRIHFLPRQQNGHEFLQLLNIGDVILHPFPFGGSRTSAEALLIGKPVVTLPTNFLRARMALSFYMTMNMTETVAKDVDDYVNIAVKLGTDKQYRQEISSKILEKQESIWHRRDVVFEWARFLCRAAGVSLPSQEEIDNELLYSKDRKHTSVIADDDDTSEENDEKKNINYKGITSINGQQIKEPSKEGKQSPSGFKEKEKEIAEEKEWKKLLKAARESDIIGDVEKTVGILRELNKQFPNDAGILNDLGAALVNSYKLEEAEMILKRAIELEPGHITAINNLGVTLVEMGRSEEALECYEKSLIGQTFRDSKARNAALNYGNFLRDQNKMQDAIDVLQSFLELPPMSDGGAFVVLLSMLDIQPAHEERINFITSNYVSNLELRERKSIYNEIIKVQENDLLSITNSISIFMQFLRQVEPEQVVNLLQTIARIEDVPVMELENFFSSEESELHLIIQYYNSPISKNHQNLCLTKNLLNPFITQIHILTEEDIDFSSFPFASEKINQIILRRRMTFKDAFEYANINLLGKKCIVSNSDIFFDDTLHRLVEGDLENKMLALLRWEIASIEWSSSNYFNYKDFLLARVDSQDTWIFQSPLPDDVLRYSDFYFGLPRCDNRLAKIFEDAGLEVSNPTLAIKTYHLNYSQNITGSHHLEPIDDANREERPMFGSYSRKNQVHGDCTFVKISDQWKF